MLWGRFIYEYAEICLWPASLSINMVHSDINLKVSKGDAVFPLIPDAEYYAVVWSYVIENGNESHGKSENEIKVREGSSLRTANHKAPALVT